MATACFEGCNICANSFNSDFYLSVSLSCGHDFCLLCLVRLRASGKNNCPNCRRNWAGFDLPALPGQEALAAILQVEHKGKGDMDKKKNMSECCEKHLKKYKYWVMKTNGFYCSDCVPENSLMEFVHIHKFMPQIKEAMAHDVPNAKIEVESSLKSLNERREELEGMRDIMRKFMEKVEEIDHRVEQEIREVADEISKASKTSTEIDNMKEKLNSIPSFDIRVALECKSTLKNVAAPSSGPTLNLPQTLMCNIACSYMKEAATEKPPCKASFVCAVKTYAAKPSPETVAASEKLEDGKPWTVDNNNCEAALLALADRQPSLLTLVARDDAREALPVAALARAAKGCEVYAQFVDTFFSADNSATDAARLEHLTANKSLRLRRFYGHLDKSAIAKLPPTIVALGLAIGSAADAAAVSGLQRWKELEKLDVSVSSRVTADDLKSLVYVPKIVPYFPFLSDAGVESVKPAIEILAKDLRIDGLRFPKSQLTADGADHLTQQLKGVKLTDNVIIEASGSWQPTEEEKKIFGNDLRSATGCLDLRMWWDMGWIYR